MCDQDHFEDDRQEYEARGLVTRREFSGAILGTGLAFVLPQVLNAVAVTESDVTVTTPDGTADCYFVHPATGTGAAVLFWPDIFGLRPAMRQMGKRLAESGYSVLVVNPFYRVQKAPTAPAGAKTEIKALMPLAQALNETTHMTDARAFIGWLDKQPSVATNRKVGHAGVLHGRPDLVPHGGRDARPCRRGRLVSRWRPRDRCAKQPAPPGLEDQGPVPHRHRRKR